MICFSRWPLRFRHSHDGAGLVNGTGAFVTLEIIFMFVKYGRNIPFQLIHAFFAVFVP